MSPTAPAQDDADRPELLGSLTTQQQQRTSARVIKKLKLEPLEKKIGKRTDGSTDDLAECDTPSKTDEKELLKFPTVKQRMPKALWSIDEKRLFFEALNEYGKDFDSITAYICAKMKKKGMPDVNLKTKTQVSHFYYRTWHKLSKYLHFDENVKKVAQELYALINYGELRKKLASVSEKTCARLGEMVRGGSMVVRARGRNLRVRTPACRALRKLNQITEREFGARVCSRASVTLRARDVSSWTRVQAAAHNPRALVALPLRTRLRAFIRALSARWTKHMHYKPESEVTASEVKCCDDVRDPEDLNQESNARQYEEKDDEKEDLEDHLNLETDRLIVLEQRLTKKVALHVGPRPNAEIHLPVLSPSEQLSSQKICFSSYLERMCQRDKNGAPKIRTPKRQRKDSASEKDKDIEPKKMKLEECDTHKLMNIDETAIDGIELMANYKNVLEDEEKPSTEDEKETKAEETADEEAERDVPERDKDMSEREKDSFSEMEDDEKFNKTDSDNESDQGKNGKQKFKNLKVKFRIRPKKRGGSIYTVVIEKNQMESKNEEQKIEEETKPDIDVELATKQIRKGWSEYDAGDLTIGDLYLMFGSRSKLELDYWWAEPTPPLPQPLQPSLKTQKTEVDKEKQGERKDKGEKGIDSVVEDGERVREIDTDIFSPKNTYSQDSNDGLSGDERKGEQLASPDHKSSSSGGTLKLVSKLVNRPQASTSNTLHQNGFSQLSERLKRLLALVGNNHVGSAARCQCGHICSNRKQTQTQKQQPGPVLAPNLEPAPVFRHPTPIKPRQENEVSKAMSLEGVPRWRRGRPKKAERRVVVQRLLPLLPKLPPPNNLIPVKIVPNSTPAPPRILPKPPPTSTSDLSFFYVLSESNGQFFFHDGDRRIPITPQTENEPSPDQEADSKEDDAKDVTQNVEAAGEVQPAGEGSTNEEQAEIETDACKPDQDIGNFLRSESLSPSRLLAEGWLATDADYSLSSFLHHLDNRPHADLAVDSQLQSLMAESSVDYVAKFADLAAEVTGTSSELRDDVG